MDLIKRRHLDTICWEVCIMNIKKETCAVCEILGLTQEELAQKLGVSFQTVSRWINEHNEAEKNHIEKLYSFAYANKIYLNDIYEQLFSEEYQKEGVVMLFHGCKTVIDFPIDLHRSKKSNDFGPGFYLGESFKQAATYIANSSFTNVYTFALNLKDLRVASFNVDRDWMMAIAYYRGWIDRYKDDPSAKAIVDRVEGADVVLAPIADNRMFDIISEFVRGEITDLQCQHALSATNLGRQYVIKTEKGLRNLSLIRLNYLSKPEKESCVKQRLEMNNLSQDKVAVARIEYRGKGKYIEELFK